MKILEVLTYYRPHMSGLSIYVERLSEALARQGHDVTILTSQYDPDLSREETINGVKIVRVPVLFRISKGVIMPTFGLWANRLCRQSDVIHLHLPQFDAPGLALRGKLFRKPVVITYHCDLKMPSGLFNRLVDKVVAFQNNLAGALADAFVTYTQDYGENSPYLSRYLGSKLQVIPPPVTLAACPPEVAESFQKRHQLEGRPVIGIAARMAAEKGIEVLLKALPAVLKKYPNARVLHAGPVEKVLGEETYQVRISRMLEQFGDQYKLLGPLEGPEFTAFYKNLDCLVIPSLNSTESFGLVQIEAMMNGAPVVASNLPGVRQPVTMTGMGEVIPVGDHAALASSIINILDAKEEYVADLALIGASFSPDQTASGYTNLFEQLMQGTFEPNLQPDAYKRLQKMRDSSG